LRYGVIDACRDLCGGSLADVDLRTGEFWANQLVSFEIRAGECVGLIGHNGAGKTTILKMLNGLIKPDRGRIQLRGRVGALIALGAGFNPVLTGRENIMINGAVLGMSRREILDRLDEIVAFAELAEFIDTPVRNYSSGMQVRLGFAVASSLQPDIMLIDEVLAVGDLDFRMKCITRIAQLLNMNTAVVLVSHSMADIQRVCSRTIVMDRGQVAFDGDPGKGIAQYERLSLGNRGAVTKSNPANVEKAFVRKVAFFVNGAGCPGTDIEAETGDRLNVEIEFEIPHSLPETRIRVYFESSTAGILTSVSSSVAEHPIELVHGINCVTLTLPTIPFRVGAYGIGVSMHAEERTSLMSAMRIGILRISGPAIGMSATTDAGLVAVASQWSRSSSSSHSQEVAEKMS
jgi:lipopolysaccharide transport system ATP-binding protein